MKRVALRCLALLVTLPAVSIAAATAAAKDEPGEIYVVTGRSAPVDVSRSPASDAGAVVSPGGDTIAFWSDRGDREHLYLVDPDGTHLRRVAGISLPAVGFFNVGPIAFADGGAELYTSDNDETASGMARATGFRVDVRRAKAVDLPWCHGDPVPAPSGESLACPTPGLGPRFEPVTNTAVWHVDAAGHRARLATVLGSPLAWTPNGRVLFVQPERGGLAASVPGSGKRARVLYRGNVTGLSFPAGSRLVDFQPVFEEHRFEVPVAGGPVTTLWNIGPFQVVSSTGRRAYARGRSLIVTGPGGRSPHAVARYGPDSIERLAWFPDGRRLLVSAVTDHPARG